MHRVNCHSVIFLQLDNIPCPYKDDFRCTYDGYCIRDNDVCDRYEDCMDGADEGMNC